MTTTTVTYLACIEAVQQAAQQLGHAPSQSEYEQTGIRPVYMAVRRYLAGGGPWEDVLRAAGVEA